MCSIVRLSHSTIVLPVNVFSFIQQLENDWHGRDQIVHVEDLPHRKARYGRLSNAVHPQVQSALRERGIEKLYLHQTRAISKVRGNHNVVVVTGTASGKTLCYKIPILEKICNNPQAKALLIYPTKALAQDQLRGFQGLLQANPNLKFEAGTYDGDTPTDQRRKLRDKSNCILTNPDMLHCAILPNHDRWASFFSNLQYVVVDEIHIYRGIFGSHFSNVIRRLNRVCRRYGSKPTFVCCSATIANPKELAERIIHQPCELVDEDGSPSGPKRFVMWNPPFVDQEKTSRRSANSEATRIMSSLVEERIQTITFSRTRLSSELIFKYLQDDLDRHSPKLAKAVHAYRGGYLPEERREIERRLASGELIGVSSTNALELGIDIGGLDACIIVGYPGTIASTWQQAGRAGRGQDEAAVFLVGQNSPIDQYLMHHPEYIFGKSPEHAIVDPNNPHLAIGHLRCALAELPLEPDELDLFGPHTQAMLDILMEHNQARQVGNQWRRIGAKGYPAGDVELRVATDAVYTIQDSKAGNKVIGTIDELSAYSQVHTHAIYLHAGETYFVDELDTDRKIAFVTKTDVDYYTQAVDDDKLIIDEVEKEERWRETQVQLGEVRVTTNWLMFKKVKFQTRESIGYENLDLPTYTLETTALWLIPPGSARRQCAAYERNLTDGLIGIANLITEVMPLFVMCDPSDVGAVVESTNLNVPTLFVFDKYEGGIGFAEKAFELIEEIMQSVLRIVQECPCKTGCPSCVGSAITVTSTSDIESGTRDRLPDKEAALIILHDMLQLEPYKPKHRNPEQSAPPKIEDPEQPLREIPKVPLPPSLERKIRKRVKKYQDKTSDQ